ncbi:hypothetical protein NQ314_006155 [Rhamnusium bicolor]|uniref:BTB domain-containing protein n=1 Tax=Rhamnusium bicolor TaxID=1586634 RepID=A0AAV8Z688_9CUCU|nr:hypothetical protein NQ314_006155 [Rhamnusium bicolor]
MSNENLVFQQNDLFPSAFPLMADIRRQGKLCDVVLKVDGQHFSAHKIVLASTIPYFHAMFMNDMIESRNKEIEIKCIDATALEALVNFAYSGKVILDKNNVQSIMIGASYLQLNKVRDACANYLLQREEQVFEACMRWMKHYVEKRKEHLPELLSLVRLPLLSPLYITDRVRNEDQIRYSIQCRKSSRVLNNFRDLVDEALTFHLIPERRALIQSFRTEPRVCDIKGYIYVVGGLNRHGDSLSTVEYYDPKIDKWHMAPPMSMMRSRLGVAVLKSKLYAFGGYNGKDRLSSVEVYDAVKKEWSMVTPMLCKRSALGATALGDIIYVCGGYDGVTSLNSVERYHPSTNSWCSLAPMNKSRSAGAVIACQGYIYALGGHDGLSIFDSVERYNPATNTWIEAPPMLTKKVSARGCNARRWTYVAPRNAQRSRVALTANMVYDPKMDKWTYAADMIAHEGGVGLGVISIP